MQTSTHVSGIKLLIFFALVSSALAGAPKAIAAHPCPCDYTHLYEGSTLLACGIGFCASPSKNSACYEIDQTYVEVITQLSNSCYIFMSTYRPTMGQCSYDIYCAAHGGPQFQLNKTVQVQLTDEQLKGCREELLHDVKHGLSYCEPYPAPLGQ